MHSDLFDATAGDHITMALAEEPRGALRPLSIDLQVRTLQVHFSVSKAKAIGEVLQAEFARAVRSICLAVPPEMQIVNAPDFRMRIRGLSVEGYSLLARTSEDGHRRFTLRLRRAAGNALALLKLAESDNDALSAIHDGMLQEIDRYIGADQLFDEMLAHLYLPLINLNSYLRTVLDGQSSCSGEEFSISAVQLKARTEILQFAFDRMIAELMVCRASASESAARQHAPQAELREAQAAPVPGAIAARPLQARVA